MDEPINTFDISLEQQNTAALIQRLLGQRIADRYVDFCRLAAGAFPLRVSSPVAAHALRELESILRQTLEVPMDVAITPSREQIERIEQAKAQLQALGFKDDEIQRVAKELKPRLSHKQQIQAIATRLGLAPDGDIARAWNSISGANAEAHGGRALHQSIVVDDAFRADWQAPFDTVMRGLMIALQGKYAAFVQRIDQLIAMPDRGAAATSFSKEIPGALPLLWHFFNKLETPDWLPHLAKRNLLAAPLSQADEAGVDGSFLRQWPAGRYLLRMAKSSDAKARALIADTLRSVAESKHPDVQQMALEILAALPANEAAPLVHLAEAWLTPDARFIMAQGPHELIKTLAQGGECDAALRVTRAVFKVFAENERLATLFGSHMYEHHLPEAIDSIAPVCKADAVALVSDLLDQAVRISRKVTDDPSHDYTYFLSGEVSEHGIKHDVIDALVGGIVRASKLAIEADPACMRDIVMRIRGHSPKVFTRIVLHVLSINPACVPDLAQTCLTDPDLIEETWCRTEYGELARAWFPSLPASVQQEILACVDSVPDKYRDRFNERFEQHEKRPPTLEEQRNRDESVVRDLLWHWREVLPADRREALEKLGDPDAWRHRLYEPEKSPLTAPDFSTTPIEEIVAFLETWRPSSGEQRETATALAQELRSAAMGSSSLYSTNAARFAQLPPIYVRRLLEGLSNASNNKNGVDWNGALVLIEVVARPAVKPLSSGIEGDDPDWSWTRKAAIELLASGLRRGADGIPFAYAGLVQELILELYRAAPRQPDTENFEESYRRFPHFGAQSTWRGAAVELAILFVSWLSKDQDSEVGRAPREALEKLPEIRQIFETELTDRTASGRIPRAVMGRYLTWFAFFADPWLRQCLPALLPGNDLSLRDAAWLAHLSADNGPISVLAPDMRDCYVAEINRLGKDTAARDQQHVDDRLAEYLIILYIQAAFADDVFELFWNSAPVRSRQHAIWFLGVQLDLPPDKLPADFRARALSYWDRRLAAAKASTTPDHFREELGAIGQLFFRKGISDEWLMDQVLSMSEAGFAPGEPYRVIDRLAKISPNFPDRAAETLSTLVKNPRFDRWVYMTQSAGMRVIFVNGLATGFPKTAVCVSEAVNYLAAMGDTSYLDLLPNPQLTRPKP
ncbi:hypothetical protein RPPS3_09010 [Rhodopseudomonas palustris]|uniref:hypothetical protein n=1 Tax=Rhodopseudomonas palustris TaxID=1076 RepID=UPI000D19DA15|nr:hypothetical protein [Rhodopseudomonas palustris]AVT74964.1 hypothetical protein RPPS3_09010 [Rhodopseudomonas palustris]